MHENPCKEDDDTDDGKREPWIAACEMDERLPERIVCKQKSHHKDCQSDCRLCLGGFC